MFASVLKSASIRFRTSRTTARHQDSTNRALYTCGTCQCCMSPKGRGALQKPTRQQGIFVSIPQRSCGTMKATSDGKPVNCTNLRTPTCLRPGASEVQSTPSSGSSEHVHIVFRGGLEHVTSSRGRGLQSWAAPVDASGHESLALFYVLGCVFVLPAELYHHR